MSEGKHAPTDQDEYHEAMSNAELVDVVRQQEAYQRRSWALTEKAGGRIEDKSRDIAWILADRLEAAIAFAKGTDVP